MPKPRKKIKHLQVSQETNKSKLKSATEDLVGNFLVSIFTAFITALMSQAVSNQINWFVVVLAFTAMLVVLFIYQRQR